MVQQAFRESAIGGRGSDVLIALWRDSQQAAYEGAYGVLTSPDAEVKYQTHVKGKTLLFCEMLKFLDESGLADASLAAHKYRLPMTCFAARSEYP
jgi:hypothetical protein